MIKQQLWLTIGRDIVSQYEQCLLEGRDVEPYHDLVMAFDSLPAEVRFACEPAIRLVHRAMGSAPIREDLAAAEPSDKEGIFAACPKEKPVLGPLPDENILLAKLEAAWNGRVAGCWLGKPMEQWCSRQQYLVQKATDNYPLQRYMRRDEIPEELFEKEPWLKRSWPWPDTIRDEADIDDDTNYPVLNLRLVQRYGRDFTPENILEGWMTTLPLLCTYTAERITLVNASMGMEPPQTAAHDNPFREWLGAQIRADLYGWINPGDPYTAADMAWRDASISHVKNGIYGEMWVAAMLAGAAAGAGIEDSIRIGLSYIPEKSRLYEAIEKVLDAYHGGVTAEDFFADLQKRWDNYNQHDWCHTISNAEIVAASLLYGGGDYGKSICMAVEQGFDTDCNGATAGSVLGMILGADAIPAVWKDKIGGKLHTQMFGFETVLVDEMAEKTLDFLAE